MDLVSEKTGEVFEIKKEPSSFRSITDLKEYDQVEKYEPGSSQVDLTGYEPLESIVARCTRVMQAPGGQTYHVLDVDAVKAESIAVPSSIDYEAGSAKTIDEAFDTEDPTETEGFDLVDASNIMSKVSSRLVANENSNVGSVANNVRIEEALDASEAEAQNDEIDDKVASGTKSPSAA